MSMLLLNVGGTAGGSGPSGSALLLETSGYLLLETSGFLLLEV